MQDWAMPLMSLVALVCGISGLGVGYALGFRNGSATGELRALHVTMTQMRERRRSRRHLDEPETADRLD
jgi:hypothetical protein